MEFFNKPKSVIINMANLTFDMIEGWEPAKNITRDVMRVMDLPFDKELHDRIDKNFVMYFLVLKNKEYDVVSGMKLISLLNEVPVKVEDAPAQTFKYKACRKQFVKYVLKQYNVKS